MSEPRIKLHGETLNPRFERYHNGALCLRLVGEDGQPYMTASTNADLPGGRTLAPDEVIVKDYSENAGVLAALEASGLVETGGWSFPSGHVILHVRKVTAELPADL